MRFGPLASLALFVLFALPPVTARPAVRSSGNAQSVRADAMKKLERWIGEWKGSGWSTTREGKRVEFDQVERVQSKIGGTVFSAEGRSVTENERGEEVVLHDGLALVYFDAAAGQYRWHGHDAPWGAIEAEVKLVDGGFSWSLATGQQGASVRFTILVDEKSWREVGEATTDGKIWAKIMETELQRVSDRAPPRPSATQAAELRIDGECTRSSLSIEKLRELGAKDVRWTTEGVVREFKAVSLESILRSVGIVPGEMKESLPPSDKRAGWKFAVVATAGDDFQAVFSVAELYQDMGRTEAYVAFEEGGKPLDPSIGPLRIIVPSDREGSRSIRHLERLTLVDLRRVAPAR